MLAQASAAVVCFVAGCMAMKEKEKQKANEVQAKTRRSKDRTVYSAEIATDM
jgi:mannitol-specific phosphotransferase system IIBC component